MSKVGIFDPSLGDNEGTPSTNLGDIIIYQSVMINLNRIFPNSEFVRVSTHTSPTRANLSLIKSCDTVFVGGTNLLSSDTDKYNQWKMENRTRLFFSGPIISNVVLMGVGWWQYQGNPTNKTSRLYKKLLSASYVHSVRDGHTQKMLISAGITNVINTSCPTTWELNGMNPNKQKSFSNCILTLTDYSKSPVDDELLINMILEYYSGQIFYFPQGSKDIQYIMSLKVFQNNKQRIEVLEHSVDAFEKILSNEDVDYVGTRLHAGIKALQSNKKAIIVAIDNRAIEMGRDINLPVVHRNDLGLLKRWLSNEAVFSEITLPTENIIKWKAQFANL
jgi:polysaccharide pyruvyl transferase WcaK-like protein